VNVEDWACNCSAMDFVACYIEVCQCW